MKKAKYTPRDKVFVLDLDGNIFEGIIVLPTFYNEGRIQQIRYNGGYGNRYNYEIFESPQEILEKIQQQVSKY